MAAGARSYGWLVRPAAAASAVVTAAASGCQWLAAGGRVVAGKLSEAHVRAVPHLKVAADAEWQWPSMPPWPSRLCFHRADGRRAMSRVGIFREDSKEE